MNVSIIICTYNRFELLQKSLASIVRLNIPVGIIWELIVVDNNSSDSTRRAVQVFVEQGKLPLRYIFEKNQGLSNARNRGIEESTGEILAFIDDDVILPSDWLEQVINAFTLYDVDVISGKVILDFEKPLPAWLDYDLQQCFGAFDHGDEVVIFKNPYDGMVGIGANICFKRSIFHSIGMFDIFSGRNGKKLLMGEETELIRRVMDRGGKCVYFPKMYLYHIAGEEKISKKYVLEWHYRWGQWEAQFNKSTRKKLTKKYKLIGWTLKVIIYDLIKFFSCLYNNEYDRTFKIRVNVFKKIGYLSSIL